MQCYFCRCSQWTICVHTNDPKHWMRLILKKSKCDHVTPLLKEPYWHPVKCCIQYKLTMLAFRHFNGTLPPYLSSSLCTYQPSCSLCSSTGWLLKIPKTNLKTFGGHSFGYIAPTVWNSLLAILRASPSFQMFKAKLKTNLFCKAFWLIYHANCY